MLPELPSSLAEEDATAAGNDAGELAQRGELTQRGRHQRGEQAQRGRAPVLVLS
jgi:hypothetical protein